MTIELIKTDVPCPGCAVPLCNLCGLNGYCQDCHVKIDRATDQAIVEYIEKHRA